MINDPEQQLSRPGASSRHRAASFPAGRRRRGRGRRRRRSISRFLTPSARFRAGDAVRFPSWRRRTRRDDPSERLRHRPAGGPQITATRDDTGRLSATKCRPCFGGTEHRLSFSGFVLTQLQPSSGELHLRAVRARQRGILWVLLDVVFISLTIGSRAAELDFPKCQHDTRSGTRFA